MPSVRVAVVGNLSLDLVEDGPPRPGGPPHYAARALAALGAPALVRVKCAEADRPRLLPPLEQLGLPVEWRPGTTTASYAFSYDGDVRSMDVRALGSSWSPDDVAGLDADWVHVGALFRGEFPPETLAALAEAGVRLSFDGQGLVRPAETGPLVLQPEPKPSFLRYVSMLKLSEEEALALVGGLYEGPLSELGVPEVIVTLGSRGCLVVVERQFFRVSADPLEVEPTGAGDSFAGAYVVERSRGNGPLEAAEHATQLVHELLAGAR
jgi:sugar/nucleoside kinase (ribokinase family)